jgi:hypothetical protein
MHDLVALLEREDSVAFSPAYENLLGEARKRDLPEAD